MNKQVSWGLAMMIAILLKVAATVALGFTFEPLPSVIAFVVFVIGLVLTVHGMKKGSDDVET